MIEIESPIRTAFITALRDQITYLGKVIPIDEENLNVAPAQIQVGNSTGFEAFMLVRNQTVNDDSAKCSINQNSSIQLDCVTTFNGNSGNSYHAQQIKNLVFAILFPNGGKRLQLSMVGLYMWRGWYLSGRTTVDQDTNTKTYRSLAIFSMSVGQ